MSPTDAHDPALSDTTPSEVGAPPSLRPVRWDFEIIDGRYHVEAVLGEGAMGVVYRAHEPALDRHVALKTISAEWVEDAAFSQRFHEEARALARIRHPNVVQLYTFGLHEGACFLAMELIEGASLAEVIRLHKERDAWVSVHNAVMLLSQVIDGVAAIHAASLLHCDLKPSNVVVEQDTGRPVIIDFGVATNASDGGRPLAGSPGYMAPEHRDGMCLSEQTDIYALGCTAFELLTRRLPFEASSIDEMLHKHREAPIPRLSLIRPELEAFDEVIARALAKSPSERFRSCSDMRVALDRAHRHWGQHPSTPARPMDAPAPEQEPCVLVVDDDPGFRRALARVARLTFGDGLSVITASSGEEALALAVQHLPRLIVLDYMLPRLDGVTTLSVIRSLPQGHDVRVVVVSASVEEVRWKFVALGVRHFLSKPVDLEQLSAMLGDLVED